MPGKIKKILSLSLLSLVPSFLIWLPFFFRLKKFWSIPLPQNGMATIVANYDGPLFLVVAKTFYNPELIKAFFQFPLPTEYYAAHFPLFPVLIKTFSFLLGYPYAMLFATLLSSTIALFFFNKLISLYVDKKNALWLTFLFSIFPARWLIVRSVGSAEPLFVAAIIASLLYFKQKNYLLAGVWGAVAQLTKSPGIILFIAYLAMILSSFIPKIAATKFVSQIKSFNLKKYLPILFIPLSLLLVFLIYQLTYHNFFTYFKSGDNIHLFFPPFQVFNYSAPWVGTFWLEEVIFVYLLGGLGLAKLIKQSETAFAWFVGIFFLSILFVSHRDIIRYALPIVPFLIIAFKETLISKEFKYVLLLLIAPIYLFSLAFISQNVMPISNWSPFL